jgi:hypothetical protein
LAMNAEGLVGRVIAVRRGAHHAWLDECRPIPIPRCR